MNNSNFPQSSQIFFLGDITIKYISDFSFSMQNVSDRTENFCAIPKENIRKGREEVYIHFTRMPAPCIEITGNLIFQEFLFQFYKDKDGSLQLSQYIGEEKWLFIINSEFSIFKCYILAGKAERIDFYQLVFNRFFLQHTFINHHGLIIHAAGGSINGKGMVFPAVSGTGKSTLSHLLLPFSENQLFSEERIIMRKMNDGWHLWGTPWKGTGSIARNESAPLSALVFLSQAPETKITPLPTSAALRRLLETVSIPWYSQEWTDKGLAVCESLLRDIPAFELAFRPDETAVQAVADFAASLP